MLKWLTLLVAATLAATTIAGRVLHARDDARWRPPGRLVDIGGGRRMHLYCTGTGSPTVVLEAGLGDFSVVAWAAVQPRLSAITRVCSYDRAGNGWSDPSPEEPLPDESIADLQTLLRRAGEQAPFVLVGHSLGGPLVRHYAVHYAAEVAGLVTVDGSHEDQQRRIPDDPRIIAIMTRVLPVINRLGIDRTAGALSTTDSISAIRTARFTRAETIDNVCRLGRELDRFTDVIRRDARPFGDLPLVVLIAGLASSTPGQSVADAQQAHTVWIELQKDIASRSTRGRWQIADRSTHAIQWDQPEVVIQAVREVVDMTRAPTTTPVR